MVWIEAADAPALEVGETVPLCMMRAPCLFRTAAEEAMGRDVSLLTDVLIADSVGYVRSGVVAGLGVTVLGASSLGPDVRINRAMMQASPLPQITLGLHGSDPRRDQVAQVLREVLAQQMPHQI
jgi:DNA-binding transcriptional LysR family regulator